MVKRARSDSQESDTPNLDVSQSQQIGVEYSTHFPKYIELEADGDQTSAMECLLPPHKPLKFQTYDDHESHYNQAHANRCSECLKNFPTAHFLDLHLTENHDPIVATRRDKGEKTFACFVEGCKKVCGEWRKRRSHLVDKHGFPKNYDFLIVNSGIDGRRSMLRRGIDAQGHRSSSRGRSNSDAFTEANQMMEAMPVDLQARESKGQVSTMQVTESPPLESGSNEDLVRKDDGIGDLTNSMSSLKFIPSSVTFGRRKARTGFPKN